MSFPEENRVQRMNIQALCRPSEWQKHELKLVKRQRKKNIVIINYFLNWRVGSAVSYVKMIVIFNQLVILCSLSCN